MKIFIMILGLVTNVYIIRKLSVNDYGVFSLALMLIGLITSFGFSWSSSSILYYGSKDKEKNGNINKTFWARNIIIFFSLSTTTILFVVFGTQINEYIGLNISYYLLAWLYVSVAEDYLSQYFLAVKKQVISGMLSITAKVIYLVLILLFSFDVMMLIILNIISHASVLVYIIRINRNDVGRYEVDKEWFKQILNFSLWQLFGYSGIYIINFGDTAVIKYFMTVEDVGIYNAAYKLFAAITAFANIILSYFASAISTSFLKDHKRNLYNFFYRDRLIIIGLSLIVHVLVIVFSKPIISMLYGNNYIEASSIFSILMIGSMVRFASVYYTLYFNSNNMHKHLQIVNMSRAIVNIILDVIFINLWGIVGPAIATTVAFLLSGIYMFIYSENKLKKICTNSD